MYSMATQLVDRAWYGKEWNGNFGMEYARMEWNRRFQEWNGRQPSIHFHTNSILDFAHGIYRKIYTDSDN